MAYSRFRLRAKLLDTLEQLPNELTPDNISILMNVIKRVRVIHKEFTNEPFEYVDDATKDEHHDLSVIFTKLLWLTESMWNDAMSAFANSQRSHSVDPQLIDIKDKLSHRAEGTSATAMLLSNFFQGSESNDQDD